MTDSRLALLAPAARRAARPHLTGRVRQVLGLTFDIGGIQPAVGDAVRVRTRSGELVGEVVALVEDGARCMAFGDLQGVRNGDRVEPLGEPLVVPVGEAVLGRVLDGLGRPIDGGPPLDGVEHATVGGPPPHPLRRSFVEDPIGLGVRSLDTMVPCGRGQRLGIFAGSGVGKSSLLSMIVRGTDADAAVLALIGERGREVREFIERDLGPSGLGRASVVVATSDAPPLVRLNAAFAATRIAESLRDEGRDVLLMMDSVTRFATAQREVGLSAGEVPATRGYPPSVFALLPRLLERAGTADSGSITGLYTVLVEGDDMNEPVADAVRSILDGHVVLSRQLANTGHFPSVDVLASVSRLAPALLSESQRVLAGEMRRLLAVHEEARDLLEIGAYVRGTNPVLDAVVAGRDHLDRFLRQDLAETTTPEQAWAALGEALSAVRAPSIDEEPVR